jgi:hypothetical protein
VAAVLTALLQQRRRLAGYAVFLLLTLGLLIPAGHLGASMTHGPDFLFEPFDEPGPARECSTIVGARLTHERANRV